MVGTVIFIALAVVALIAAMGMLLSDNAIYSALFLIVNFATIAVLYLLLNAPFLAMVQVTVYAGAIMVLFLFVIMLLGAERVPIASRLRWQVPLAILLVFVLMAATAYTLASGHVIVGPPELGRAAEAFGSPAQVGEVLFNEYLFPFELTSILLLVAMIGAVVLTRDEKKGK
jgi:NADH-quinone oxidoreductase subunit J